MVVAIYNSVHARGDSQPFYVGSEASDKVITEPGLLRLVKKKTLSQIFECIFRYQDLDHRLPMVALTASQSSSRAFPSRTRARRSSRSFLCSSGISECSKRSRK